MASCIFRDIFGMTWLWPLVFSRIFLECLGCGLLYFRDIFGVTRLWPPAFFEIFIGVIRLWPP